MGTLMDTATKIAGNPIGRTAVDIASKIIIGRIMIAIMFFVLFFGYSTYTGYNKLVAMDSEYHFSESADYILVSRDKCTFIYNTSTLQIIKAKDENTTSGEITKSCSILTSPSYVRSIIAKQNEDVRGVNINSMWNYWFPFVGGCFFIMILCYLMSSTDAIINRPKSTFCIYAVTWLVFAVFLFPSTYGEYGSVSIYTPQDNVTVYVENGRITKDGKWLSYPQSNMGRIAKMVGTFPDDEILK